MNECVDYIDYLSSNGKNLDSLARHEKRTIVSLFITDNPYKAERLAHEADLVKPLNLFAVLTLVRSNQRQREFNDAFIDSLFNAFELEIEELFEDAYKSRISNEEERAQEIREALRGGV